MKLQRGFLYTADLSPSYGTEPGKIRPVLVLQTDLINGSHPSTLVCCLTTQVKPKVEILRVHLCSGEAGLKKASDIMIDQVRAIDNRRFKRRIGKLSPTRLQEVARKLGIVLDLPETL